MIKDIKNAKEHLEMHQKYPATYEELVKECDNLSDFSEADKGWFKTHLPNRTYKSADDVMNALGMNKQPSATM